MSSQVQSTVMGPHPPPVVVVWAGGRFTVWVSAMRVGQPYPFTLQGKAFSVTKYLNGDVVVSP